MNDGTRLLRQIAEGMIREGRLSSETFLPNRRQQPWSLSVYSGDMITDKAAINHYRVIEGGNTIGLAWVTVLQCEELGLGVEHTPHTDFDSHCDIKFPQQSWSRARKLAQQLRDRAIENAPDTVSRIALNGNSP